MQSTVLVLKPGQTHVNIRGSGRKGRCMDLAFTHGQMACVMQGIINTGSNMAMVSFNGQLGKFTMVNGKMGHSMGLPF